MIGTESYRIVLPVETYVQLVVTVLLYSHGTTTSTCLFCVDGARRNICTGDEYDIKHHIVNQTAG